MQGSQLRTRGLLPAFLLVTSLPAFPASETTGASRQLETVLVEARRIRDQLGEEYALTPGGITVIDGESLFGRNVTNLADMLRYTPGVWSASNSGSDNMFFSSRGSNLDATNYDMNGIKLLQDGLPVTMADGSNHNRMIDPLGARFASVARGANALAYGASTLGGAIDFRTPTARESAPLEVFVNGGSHGQLTGRLTAGTRVGEAFDALLTVEGKNRDGYRDHGDQARHGVYANAGWRISDATSSRTYFSYVNNDQDLPGSLTRAQADADPDQAAPEALGGNFQLNVETWRIANRTTWAINADSTLDAGVSYEHQALYHPIVDRIMVDFDGPGPAPPVEVFSLLIDTDHENIGAMVRYNLRAGSHDLLAGIDYGTTAEEGGNYRNAGGRPNGLTTGIDNDATSLEAYVLDRWRLDEHWTLIYGAQVVAAGRDVRNTDVATGAVRNPEDDYTAINPRAGVIFHAGGDIDLFANVSRLYEAPTSFELQDDRRGNDATLDAMHGIVAEIGSRGRIPLARHSSWGWDVALYHGWLRDEILSVDDPAAPGTSLSTNINDTIHAGVEALLDATLALDDAGIHRIEPLVSATWNGFRFDDDPIYGDNRLPAAPRHVIKGEVLYRHGSGFYIGPTFDLVGSRHADFTNTWRVGAYELLGLRAGVAGRSWEAFVEARNLLDSDHIATLTVLDRAGPDAAILNPGEPRSVYAGLKLQF